MLYFRSTKFLKQQTDMNTTFQKRKPIYIQEDESLVPEWQIQEVRRRDAIMDNNPDYLLDCDLVISELEKEFETV